MRAPQNMVPLEGTSDLHLRSLYILQERAVTLGNKGVCPSQFTSIHLEKLCFLQRPTDFSLGEFHRSLKFILQCGQTLPGCGIQNKLMVATCSHTIPCGVGWFLHCVLADNLKAL